MFSTNYKIYLISFLIVLLFFVPAISASEYTFDCQIRHRYEFIDKDFDDEISSYNSNGLRSRLGFSFSLEEKGRIYVQIQDSRNFGEEQNTLTDGSADKLDVHQAFLFLEDFFSFPLDLKLGRMEYSIGNQRLVGAVGWHPIGRSFDGLLLAIKTDRMKFDFFHFTVTEMLQPGDDGDAWFSGFNTSFPLFKQHTLTPYFLWRKTRPSDQRNEFTVGIQIDGQMNNLYHTLELAYQTGEESDNDIAAYLAAFNLGYTLSKEHGFAIEGGLDYLSGDDGSSDNERNVFDTLYATNHKFYGFMDYFLNIPANTSNAGLIDIHLRGKLKPLPELAVMLDVHSFSTAESVQLQPEGEADSIGSEIDITLSYTYTPSVKFQAGYSLFQPDDLIKANFGEDTAHWAYVMTTVSI